MPILKDLYKNIFSQTRIFHYIFEKAGKDVIKQEYFIMFDTFKMILKRDFKISLKYNR